MTAPVAVIGAGIVGVSTAIWLKRLGRDVVLIDRAAPGQGTSYGNAGVLASCSIVPVTTPGLIRNGPKYLLDPNFPLFMRWSYLPRLVPWLVRYLGHANAADATRIADGLKEIVGDSVDQHLTLARGTRAEAWVRESDYVFAYADRAAFDADAFVWSLRRKGGFEPQMIDGAEVRDYDPALSADVTCLAVMKNHGFVTDPGAYVAALAEEFRAIGGSFRQADVIDFTITDGKVAAVRTKTGDIACSAAVLTTGVWSKPLMQKLGISVPLESERGYHIRFVGAEHGPRVPTMVASGKFVATPMADGVRCAGIVEFGGLEAGPSAAPFALLRRQVAQAYPQMTCAEEIEWQGHRPAPSDSLPLIGQINGTGVFAGFGHHHIGLTGGPKTGRLLAQLVTQASPNIDMAPYDPMRFA